ncbi:hypothetical protein GDO86_006733 [Hymenochirus boettgeri]|uniref:Major facilitator superfamily (MFS) profile domain-containing protein n=1 Tax=Hymenochirus boettgeri TaxID=247094 RepID=A0A8T2JC48_9PIPI|nr:hypothetical protein GDO86_006733 [Hymenochirus boettgeri]
MVFLAFFVDRMFLTVVGLLLASKAISQLLFNPLSGFFTYRVGFDLPMFLGFIITFLSIIGMGILASKYPDDKERGEAMGMAVAAIAVGVITGPSFGSLMYHFVGKTAPFLVLAGLALLDGALQLCVLNPTKISPATTTPPSFFSLLTDPYIFVTTVTLFMANMSFAIVEATLPIWMLGTMCSPDWMLGVAFLPSSILYLLSTKLFILMSAKIGRWLCCLLGLVFGGVACICVPLAVNIYGLIAPIAVIGLTFGLVDVSMIPFMGYLVDLRHSSVYGGVYSITDIAYCLGFALGPPVGGAIAKAIGFPWLMRILGLVNILFSPVCILLRNPPAKLEKMGLIQKGQ